MTLSSFAIPAEWNCMKNGAEPIWCEYDYVEMRAVCIIDLEDGDTCCETFDCTDGTVPIAFWTVYGHVRDEEVGGFYPLHDSATEEQATMLEAYCAKKIAEAA